MSLRVVVVGGGVSGLAVAYELTERAQRLPYPVEVRCLEAGERPGGKIRTSREEEFVCEWGPNSFLNMSGTTQTLLRRLGIASRVIEARPEAANRFIYRGGALQPVSPNPMGLLRSGVLSWPGKLRLLCEPLIPRLRAEDPSIHDFASRRVGREAASVLVDAMISGIFAGDARQLSLAAAFPAIHEVAAKHGSLVRGMAARRRQAREEPADEPEPKKGLSSLRTGMQELTDALAAALGPGLQTGCALQQVSPMGQRGIRVHPVEGAPYDVDAVVLATPPSATASMVRQADPELGQTLDGIPDAPVAVVHFGFPETALADHPPGFGFLVPRGEGLRVLGTLWPSQIFRGRAPQGRRLLTTMIGGAHDPEALQLTDGQLVDIVRRDLRAAMEIQIRPYFVRVFRHERGIPQYTVGHLQRLERIRARLRDHEGLFVTGNGYHGIAVGACIEQAPLIAEQVLEHLVQRESVAGRTGEPSP